MRIFSSKGGSLLHPTDNVEAFKYVAAAAAAAALLHPEQVLASGDLTVRQLRVSPWKWVDSSSAVDSRYKWEVSKPAVTINWATWGQYTEADGSTPSFGRVLIRDASTCASFAAGCHVTVDAKASAERYTMETAYNSQWTTTKNYTSPFLHSVEVGNLEHDVLYAYRVGSSSPSPSPSSSSAFVAEASFRTPAAPGSAPSPSNPGPQVFSIIGDLGQTEFSRETREHLVDEDGHERLQLTWLVGDLAYNDGSAGQRWDSWGEMMSPLTSTVPFMALPGNHEVEYDARDESKVMVHYSNRFKFPGSFKHETAAAAVGRGTLPGQKSGYHYAWDIEYEGGSSYYSFDAGLVHFLSLNTYNTHNSGPGSPMYDFAESDLSSVDRKKTPWVLVGMHAPWYNSNSAHRIENEAATILLKKHFEPLFAKHRVNFVFAGHVHAYERSRPVAAEKVRLSLSPFLSFVSFACLFLSSVL